MRETCVVFERLSCVVWGYMFEGAQGLGFGDSEPMVGYSLLLTTG